VTWFVIISAAMTVGALAWLLPPLLRRRRQDAGVARASSNLAVLRDQLAELDADLANGTLALDQHARARAELERRVLEEATGDPQVGAGFTPGRRWSALVVGVLVPLFALLLYLQTGNPDALAPGDTHGDASVTPEQIEQMVTRLAARLEANPDDANGWKMLGRSSYALGRFGESVKAYARAAQLSSDDAGLYADYADALAMSQGRRIDDQVLVLINQALKINPDHLKALALAGSAAYDRQDYPAAVTYLERMQRQIPPDTPVGRLIAERAEDARERAGGKIAAQPATPAASPAAGATIKGRVSLSAALAGKAAPTDTVFILARAPAGPRMPLAVLKRQVKDLPLEFTLSDEQAMTPEMKLSKSTEVVVVARVSKSGNAIPQSGDLQGTTGKVKVGAAGVSVVIDAVVP
jgi:cytochrome c-type biogenesis protein CcmH